MSAAANQTNTILLHAVGVRAIDGETLAVDVPGGTMTLIFASRDAMRHTASVIIAATNLSAPVTIDELTVAFQQSSTSGPIPRIPDHTAAAESEEDDEIADLPNLDGDDDTDATESIGDVGLTQELTF